MSNLYHLLATEGDTFVQEMTAPISKSGFNFEAILHDWLTGATNFGIRVVLALILFGLGRYAVRFLARIIKGIMVRRHIDGVALSLFNSIVVAMLYVVLFICIASMLGVQSVSFAAVLASMGLAIGMALSGQLQNLAGGVILMITKPFGIGDSITAQGVSGAVRQVSLFHTQITTGDNQTIYIPNGILSSGVITNVAQAPLRRVEWTIGIDYNSNLAQAKQLIAQLLGEDERIQKLPEHVIALGALSASSVDILVRAWVRKEDYWEVYWGMNQRVFEEFNRAGISFPFPQVTISQRSN